MSTANSIQPAMIGWVALLILVALWVAKECIHAAIFKIRSWKQKKLLDTQRSGENAPGGLTLSMTYAKGIHQGLGSSVIRCWIVLVLFLFLFPTKIQDVSTSSNSNAASCSIDPAGDLVLAKGDSFGINITVANGDSHHKALFTVTLRKNIFYGADQTIIRTIEVDQGLGKAIYVTFSTQDVLQAGTGQLIVEVTSDSTGSTVLASCSANMTVYLPGEMTIPSSKVPAPVVDGVCGADEYYDAGLVAFTAPNLTQVLVYAKHTAQDLHLCLSGLEVSDSTLENTNRAAVYVSRIYPGPSSPGPDDLAFLIDYSGNVSVHRGGAGFSGPDPGGYDIQRAQSNATTWSVEIRISKDTLGGGEWDHDIGIAFFEMNTQQSGDLFSWPKSSQDAIPTSWGIGHLSDVPGSWVADLKATHIEVTQSIQSLENEVVLVADRRTFVRFYVETNLPEQLAIYDGARLYGYREDGSSVGQPLIPMNDNSVSLLGTPDRAKVNDTFLFELPSDWIHAGRLLLKAEVNPFHTVPEADYTNNTFATLPLEFMSTKSLHIRLVDYSNKCLGGTGNGWLDEAESYIRRELPISWLDTSRVSYSDPRCPLQCYENEDVSAWAQSNDQSYNSKPDVYYVIIGNFGGGCVKPDYPRFASGNPGAITHEMGHLFGLGHVLVSSAITVCTMTPESPYESYPYPDGIIGGPVGDTARFYGFDHGDPGLENPYPLDIVPNTDYDEMTYCYPQWFSDYSYTRIWNAIQSQPSALKPLPKDSAIAENVGLSALLLDRGSNGRTRNLVILPSTHPVFEDKQQNSRLSLSVRISSLANGDTFLYGQRVALEGYASDPDEGSLLDPNLRWYSDKDGFLGIGHLVYPAQLSTGTHTIILTAINASGESVSAAVQIHVVTENAPDTLPPTIICSADHEKWHQNDVVVECRAGDRQSGLAPSNKEAFTLTTTVPDGSETANAQTNSISVCDRAGNCALAGPIGKLRVDKKAPTIVLGNPRDGITYPIGETTFADYHCADGGEIATCIGTSPIGTVIDTTEF